MALFPVMPVPGLAHGCPSHCLLRRRRRKRREILDRRLLQRFSQPVILCIFTCSFFSLSLLPHSRCSMSVSLTLLFIFPALSGPQSTSNFPQMLLNPSCGQSPSHPGPALPPEGLWERPSCTLKAVCAKSPLVRD